MHDTQGLGIFTQYIRSDTDVLDGLCLKRICDIFIDVYMQTFETACPVIMVALFFIEFLTALLFRLSLHFINRYRNYPNMKY